MEELTNLLQAATAAVPDGYFQLQIDGGDPIYRERVYCYELYHQLRTLWPEDTPFYLNGEIDKAAHPILRERGADNIKPDLLVHRPGYMKGNYAIIEVKTCNTNNAGITKDLETLSLFVRNVGYERAIFLLFGYDLDEAFTKRVSDIADEFEGLPPIELWLHVAPGEPAQLIKTLD